ncbi:unnamed protein product [Ectocarpus fasciculatus]
MKHATQLEHPRILWMLLGVEGPERRQHWATLRLRNWPPLYHAATVGSYCSVKVLLAAGADAAAVSAFGEKIEEVVGKALPASKKNAATMAAIGRMWRWWRLLAQSAARDPVGCARFQADGQGVFLHACDEVLREETRTIKGHGLPGTNVRRSVAPLCTAA